MKFWKMNGAGNDFLVINNIEEQLPLSSYPAIAKTLCERHNSIGADGLIVVDRAKGDADCSMLFLNSDGTTSEMCGNGARCLCRYCYEIGLSGDVQRIETVAGLVTGVRIDKRNYRIRLNDPEGERLDFTMVVDGVEYPHCTYMELGNPGISHVVVPYAGLADAEEEALRTLGRKMRWYSEFPKGANVNFVELQKDGSVLEKTYERGVEDFTYACGTGTGASAVALTHLGWLNGHMDAHMKGGLLSVDVIEKDGKVTDLFLTGPTNIVAKGEVTDEELVL